MPPADMSRHSRDARCVRIVLLAALVAGAVLAWQGLIAIRPRRYPEIPSESVARRYADWIERPFVTVMREDAAGNPVPRKYPVPGPSPIDAMCLPRSAEAEAPEGTPSFRRIVPMLSVDWWFVPAAMQMVARLNADGRPGREPSVSASYFGLAELIQYSPGGNCIDWDADMVPDAMITDAPTEEDAEAERAEGASPLERTLLAYDPLVFHVPADSPVTNLTTAQLRRIFVDRVRTWRDAGVDMPGLVLAYAREEEDEAQRRAGEWLGGGAFFSYYGCGAPRRKNALGRLLAEIFGERRGADGRVPDGEMEPFRVHPGAIGFSMLVQAAPFVADGTVRLLSVDGVAPTAENIAAGLYPMGRSLEFITLPDDNRWKFPTPPEDVRAIVDYLRSPPGRRLIESAGYLPAPDGAPLPPIRRH